MDMGVGAVKEGFCEGISSSASSKRGSGIGDICALSGGGAGLGRLLGQGVPALGFGVEV